MGQTLDKDIYKMVLNVLELSFTCSKFYNLQEGRPLEQSFSFNRWKAISDGNSHTLIIYEAQALDAGVYACVAINSGGKATCTARLTVDKAERPRPGASPQHASEVDSPYVVEDLQPLNVEEGEPVRFSCVIKGNPRKCFYSCL